MTKATSKIGAENFWPTSLDRESDKAARTLRSFCIDGFGVVDSKEEVQSFSDLGEMQVKRIPEEVRTVAADCV